MVFPTDKPKLEQFFCRTYLCFDQDWFHIDIQASILHPFDTFLELLANWTVDERHRNYWNKIHINIILTFHGRCDELASLWFKPFWPWDILWRDHTCGCFSNLCLSVQETQNYIQICHVFTDASLTKIISISLFEK